MNSNCGICKPFLNTNSFSNAEIHLLFDNCRFYSPKLPEPNVLLFRCPSCGAQTEFQVANEIVKSGYVYFPPHFTAEQDFPVQNLTVMSNSMWLQVSVADKQWSYFKFNSKLHERWMVKTNRAKQLLSQLFNGEPK